MAVFKRKVVLGYLTILNGAKRYRLTEKGIEAIGYMENSCDMALYDFLNDTNIGL